VVWFVAGKMRVAYFETDLSLISCCLRDSVVHTPAGAFRLLRASRKGFSSG
jgi:hypothetical protein